MCRFEWQDEIPRSPAVFLGLEDPCCTHHPPAICSVAFSAKRPLVESQCLCSSDSYFGMVSKPKSHDASYLDVSNRGYVKKHKVIISMHV